MNHLILKNWLLFFLLIFLPWHGIITVFLPKPFLFWKEIILVLFFIFSLNFKQIKKFLKEEKVKNFKSSFFWAILFLIWLFILAILNQFNYYSIIAIRYLGIGFFVFCLFSYYFSHSQKFKKKTEKSLIYFVYFCVLAVLFGIWSKFGNGFEILSNFYSPTISSWVPGQTIPIFHKTNEFIRIQGASSGPIEFSHLLLVAFFLLLFSKPLKLTFLKKAYKNWTLIIILFFGIFQSFSRSAILSAMVLGIIYWWQTKTPFNKITKKTTKIGYILLILFSSFFLFYKTNFLYKNIIQRAGTSAHLTRPLEAIKTGLKNPFFGRLGSIGPAARIRNLKEKDNDQALIAENIFADYFAQTGFVGLILSLGFFITLFFQVAKKYWGFLIIILLTANLATIFDMTPLSIIYFLILAFLIERSKKQSFSFLSATSNDLNIARKITKETVGNFIKKSFEDGWNDHIFKKNFRPKQAKFIVINNKKIGLLQTEIIDKKELYVVSLLIQKTFQKQGIGSTILNNLYKNAKKQNLELTLSVHKINFNAQKFYSKMKFKKTRETKTHFFLKKI